MVDQARASAPTLAELPGTPPNDSNNPDLAPCRLLCENRAWLATGARIYLAAFSSSQ
jgi:hypothetical protein